MSGVSGLQSLGQQPTPPFHLLVLLLTLDTA